MKVEASSADRPRLVLARIAAPHSNHGKPRSLLRRSGHESEDYGNNWQRASLPGLTVGVSVESELISLGVTTFLERTTAACINSIDILELLQDGIPALDKLPRVLVASLPHRRLHSHGASEALATLAPLTRVIVFLQPAELGQVPSLLRGGVLGYLHFACSPEDLLRAVKAAVEGEIFVGPEIAKRVYGTFAESLADCAPSKAGGLSSRERSVLKLIADGCSNKDIASELHLSRRTVENHRSAIMHKLKITSMAGLVKFAVRHGVASLD